MIDTAQSPQCFNISPDQISKLDVRYLDYKHFIRLYIMSFQFQYLPMTRETRQYLPHHLILPTVSTSAYLKSFFSRTVQEWNSLPQFIIDLDYESFSINISNYYNVPVPV